MMNRFFVAFLACASVALATQTFLSGDFRETTEGKIASFIEGKFYYFFDDSNISKSRIRFKYNVYDADGKLTEVSNLYHFEHKAIFSMCGKCSAESFSEIADKWWYDPAIYEKTNFKEGDKFWYTRKNSINKTFVKGILMTDATTPTATSLAAVNFSDGRIMRFSNVVVNPPDLSQGSAVFTTDPGASCPTPTCSMFTDIVFVLDYSGSVSSSEWTQQANFAIGVMNSFTFGEYAAAAACIQFNGPYCGTQPRWTSIPGCRWSHAPNDWNYNGCSAYYMSESNTASVLAGADVAGGKTVTINKDDLITTMSKTRYPSGQTCQAFGLELAMKVFDRSPRSRYNNKPHRIVIAVTDGDDYCPNRTQAAAKKLKEQYEALFIGIGVGLECQYDKNFIMNLTSTIGNNRTYYDVSDYGAIKNVVGQLFTPLCDEFHSGCGPECNGFCGCGDCFCPSCDTTNDICYDFKCVARDGTSHGCEITQLKECLPVNTSCVKQYCDSSSGTATCKEYIPCDEVRKLNPGSCRTVTCNSSDGKCIVDINHNICNKFANGCEEWRCAGENETATDEETGCLLVRNITAECEKNNYGCFEYTCRQGQCYKVDTCALANTKCEEHECVFDNETKTYGCKHTKIENPYNETKCDIYRCDDKVGWILDDDRSLNAAKCRALDPKPACKTFNCDPDKGCVNTTDYICLDQCLDIDQECVDNATLASNLTYCIAGGCATGDNSTGHFDPHCNDTYVNCSDSDLADEIEKANEGYPSVCKTIMCQLGRCIPVTIYPTPVNNSCYYYLCEGNKTHGWDWVAYPTENVTNCHSDACTRRECDPNQGCIDAEDICDTKTNECFTLTCVNKTTNPVCVNTSELKDLYCKYDYCDYATGKKHEEIRDLSNLTKCQTDDLCMVVSCNTISGECEFTPKSPPGNDPCTNYTCDSSTGNFTISPKCDDGLNCTENKCTIDGECRFPELNCYLEINMTDYPCFRALCKETSEGHKCVRKLQNGVFIDVCGNCVRDDDTVTSSMSLPEMTECTEAPDEPMIKESLAAASIAMIVLAAIIGGAAIAGSTILGTKTLLERARAANNQSAHSNPLFEENAAEMNNPTYAQEN